MPNSKLLKQRIKGAEYRRHLRQTVLKGLGGICVSCGITEWQFLAVDHIHAGGLAHRKSLSNSTLMFYREVKNQEFPKDLYQVLCFNCNFIKSDWQQNTRTSIRFKSSTASKQIICLWCSKIAVKGGLCESCYPKNLLNVRKQNKLLKQKLIDAYGGKCQCCPENRFYALTIDHKNNNGQLDRKKFNSPYKFYRWLKNNNFPQDNYQLLCMNCNFAKQLYKICPHKQLNTSTD